MKKTSVLITLLLGIGIVTTIAFAENGYPQGVTLTGELIVNEVHLSWTKSRDANFKFYKIVHKTLNNLPKYPEDDAVWSSDDVNERDFAEKIDLQQDHYYRVCVVNTSSKTTCSNVVKIGTNRSITSTEFFNDIERGSWYETYVENLYRKEVVDTRSGSVFGAGALVDRGELAEMMVKGIVDNESTLSTSQVFCDVDTSHPQAKYINHLKKLGVVEGYPGSGCGSMKSFRPTQNVNRAEAMKMILLGFGVDVGPQAAEDDEYKYSNTDIFLDVHQSDWFAGYVARGKEDGIISGYPDDTFKPANTINRAEMSKVVWEAVKKYQ